MSEKMFWLGALVVLVINLALFFNAKSNCDGVLVTSPDPFNLYACVQEK